MFRFCFFDKGNMQMVPPIDPVFYNTVDSIITRCVNRAIVYVVRLNILVRFNSSYWVKFNWLDLKSILLKKCFTDNASARTVFSNKDKKNWK